MSYPPPDSFTVPPSPQMMPNKDPVGSGNADGFDALLALQHELGDDAEILKFFVFAETRFTPLSTQLSSMDTSTAARVKMTVADWTETEDPAVICATMHKKKPDTYMVLFHLFSEDGQLIEQMSTEDVYRKANLFPEFPNRNGTDVLVAVVKLQFFLYFSKCGIRLPFPIKFPMGVLDLYQRARKGLENRSKADTGNRDLNDLSNAYENIQETEQNPNSGRTFTPFDKPAPKRPLTTDGLPHRNAGQHFSAYARTPSVGTPLNPFQQQNDTHSSDGQTARAQPPPPQSNANSNQPIEHNIARIEEAERKMSFHAAALQESKKIKEAEYAKIMAKETWMKEKQARIDEMQIEVDRAHIELNTERHTFKELVERTAQEDQRHAQAIKQIEDEQEQLFQSLDISKLERIVRMARKFNDVNGNEGANKRRRTST